MSNQYGCKADTKQLEQLKVGRYDVCPPKPFEQLIKEKLVEFINDPFDTERQRNTLVRRVQNMLT